ncbi:5-(carboxyamino)imidazole ribonucleotide mutase [Fusobacterium russii]|uniref:5-(carboxyamino)imidazole ribonucleotide mutase n=1 Tax=Fusobacterium russii TaxID=854 RepID=UPI0003A40118|nr:5-(carboxyamino)imidazole ribonucleotide mutase [Fusobacterium russii]
MKVAIFFGSQSDKDKMKGAATCLKEFGIDFEAYVLSAHRVPEKLEEVLVDVQERGAEVIIAGAGLAAHLPGVIASKVLLPVVGVPLNGAIGGLDALYSIVQMPKSIPVATVGIDNSYNAGMLAVQILSIKYPELKEKLVKFRKEMKEKFIADNERKVEF